MDTLAQEQDGPDTSLRAILSLAWPVVLARSAQAVIGFADAVMISPLGEDAVAAVTTGSINVFMATVFPIGLIFIVQSFAAQLSARGDFAATRRYAYYGLSVAAATMIFGLVSLPALGAILDLFAYSDGVRAYMVDYLSIRLLGLGVLVGVEVLGNWYGGLGLTRLHMAAGILSMIVNVGLNAVLIEGRLGFAAMGVAGAAWASVIASTVGFALVALWFARGWGIGQRVFAGAPQLSEFVRMLRFGIPSGLNFFLEFAAVALFINVVIAGLGTSALAAMMVVFNVNSVSFMPAFGLSTAGAIIVGQAIGAERKDQVVGIVVRTLAVAVVWQVAVGLSYLLAPRQVIGLFAPPEGGEDLIAIGTTMLVLSAAWQLFDAITIVMSEVLRAAGDTAWSMWARVTTAWAVFIPAAFYFVVYRNGGATASIGCIILYLAVLAAILSLRFRTGAWRQIDLTGVDEIPV